MKAKICGVCRAADAAVAAAAGAGYVGVILAPGRSRSRTVAEATAIFAAAPGVARVGVFVDEAARGIVAAAGALGLDVVQLHGDEDPASVEGVRRALGAAGLRPRIWKALRVRAAGDVPGMAAGYTGIVDGLLLDGWSAHGHGGTGARFDWRAAVDVRRALPAGLTLVVAGGLEPGNVAEAAGLLRPDVLDVSSGVEEAPGRKSPAAVQAFIAAVRQAAD